MATLYKVKVITLDLTNRSVTVQVKVFHPDAHYFSDNPGFALRLLHDSATAGSGLSRHINHDQLADAGWLAQNARCFLAGCELKEVRAPKPAGLKTRNGYQYWRDETEELAHMDNPPEVTATLHIQTTSEAWLSHLSARSKWTALLTTSTSIFCLAPPASPPPRRC